MTLVEVVAGLALLSTLLVGLLLAKARWTRQSALAERRLRAVAAADALLADWWRNPTTLPRVGAGQVSGADALSWRTSVVPSGELAPFGAQIVRLEVIDERGQRPGDGVLASVDVVLDAPPPREQQ